jgi:hypothetical protein
VKYIVKNITKKTKNKYKYNQKYKDTMLEVEETIIDKIK